MSAGEVVVRAIIGAVAGVAVTAAVVPCVRQARRDRARFLGGLELAEQRNDRNSEGVSGDPLEFVADAECGPVGPPHPPRSITAAAGVYVVALKGEDHVDE